MTMSSAGMASSHQIMEKLMNEFKCAICLEIFVDATSTSCRHIFCRFCLTKWLQFSPKCPQCHNSVTSCTPMQSIDEEIDTLFQQMPPPFHKDRDDVRQRRRKLEMESSTSNNGNTQSKALLEKLKAQREKSIMKPEGTDKNLQFAKGVERQESKLQLPRLVSSEKLNEKVGMKLKSINGSSSQYENIKLPPIKKGSPKQRQSRGILTTTSSATKTEDTFPVGMEGDIQGDSSAEENIRELERRNKILEDQLFGAYDRIMDVIKQSNTDVANTMDPNIFRNSAGLNNHTVNTSQEPNFSKDSMIANALAKAEDNATQQQQRSNEVDDLLAETEDLIEIEDFLKKFPFERIRDDETLINYDDDEEIIDDMNLELLDADLLNDIAEHRASKCSKPLTADQQAIENFYKKLEARQENLGVKRTNNSIPQLQPPRIPKAVTQQTSSSKMKRLPSLKKFEPSKLQLPTKKNSNNMLQANSDLKTPIQRTLEPKLSSLSVEKVQEGRGGKNAGPSTKKTQNEKSGDKSSSLESSLKNQASKTSLGVSKQAKQKPSSAKKSNGNSVEKMRLPSKDLNLLKDPSCGLNYEDFLKLEIDFLDGEADWKDFEQPRDEIPTPPSRRSHKPDESSNASFKDNAKRKLSMVGKPVKEEQNRIIKIVNQNPVGIPSKKIADDKNKMEAAEEQKEIAAPVGGKKK